MRFVVRVVGGVALWGSCVWLACGAASRADDDAPASPPPRPRVELTDEALAVHKTCIVIDGHNDLPYALKKLGNSSFDELDIATEQPKLNTDIPRLRSGGVGAQFWSAYAPADTAATGEAARSTLEQIELIHHMLRRYPDTFEMASTADDIERIHGEGKIASMIGVEGGHAIENSLAMLPRYYALGARYMTLAHSQSLDWADSATDVARSDGLSPFGEEVVRTMNDLGMLVDISHVSPATMDDALRVTRAPVIASHSSAYALARHPRNVPDDILKKVAANGGVVMVNFFSGFVMPERAEVGAASIAELIAKKSESDGGADILRASVAAQTKQDNLPAGTIHDVVDHIEHIIRVAGVDHVGLGSDFDGVSRLPDQLEDVSTYPLITQELLNRGHSADDVRKILGGNVLRAMRGAEQAAKTGREG